MEKTLNFFSYLVVLLPLALVTGPFLSDLIVSSSALFFIYYSVKTSNYFYFKNLFFKFFFIFWLYIVFVSFFSDNFLVSFKSSITFIRFGIFVLLLFYLVNEKKNFLKNFTIFFLIFYLIILFDSYFQFIFGFNIFGFKSPSANRLSSFFGDEMVVGSFLSRLFPLALFCILILSKQYTKKIKYLSPVLLILVDLIIYLSGERTSFAILLIINIGFILLISQMKILRLLTFIISIIIISFITLSNDRVKDRMIDQTMKDFGVKTEKIYLFSNVHQQHYETAFKIFKDNMLIGAGPKMFRYECSDKKYYIGKFSCTTHPHNLHLQFLSEIGLIGYLFLLITLIFTIKEFLITFYLSYLKKVSVEKFDLQNCILIGVFANLFPFLPSGNFFNNWLSIIYFLPIGFYIIKKQYGN